METLTPRAQPEAKHLAATTPDARVVRVVVLVACALMVLRIAPLAFRELRVDENLTAWVTSGSFSDSISRSYRFQGQSPLYFVGMWLWRQVVGDNEFLLRLPSMIAATVLVWRVRVFSARLLGEVASWVAVGLSSGVLLLGDGPVAARPYVFGALALVFATESIVRWTTDRSLATGLRWCVASVVALYMHPFVIFAVAAQALLVFAKAPVLRRQLMVVGLIGGILCLPVVPQVLSLGARQETLVLVDQPTLGQLVFALLQPTLLVPLIVCVAIARILGTLTMPKLDSVPGCVWVWAMAPQLGVFAYSHLSGSSIFILRYFGFALPGLAIVVAAVLSDLRPLRLAALGVALSTAITALTFFAPIETRWSDAARIVNAEAEGVVFASAGFVEAADQAFIDGDAGDYLNAPLINYGVEGPIEALPLDMEAENGAFVLDLVRQYRHLDRIVVVERVGVKDAVTYRDAFGELAGPEAGYERTGEFDVPGVRITVFER